MKPNYLLPHRWMRVGVWVLIATLAAAVGFFAACMYIAFTADDPSAALAPDTPFIRTAHLLMGVLTGLGILLTAFSRERIEDEMIADVRKRAITHTAYAVFLLHIVTALLWNGCEMLHNLLHPAPLWQEYPIELFRQLALATKDPLVVFLLYQAVLRTRLAKLKQALKNEA